ncbi:MAG: hypothetical protein EZS28_000134 [Streblomastix strix]|uniref:Uncharacterized protein n=1 Tax=Streblomastix strix TaxID=222440 RepID=A0A5J4XAL3_9EUKA|nr:MAG: hypothetical protein EZS28_000134 [Streblomastix strix]
MSFQKKQKSKQKNQKRDKKKALSDSETIHDNHNKDNLSLNSSESDVESDDRSQSTFISTSSQRSQPSLAMFIIKPENGIQPNITSNNLGSPLNSDNTHNDNQDSIMFITNVSQDERILSSRRQSDTEGQNMFDVAEAQLSSKQSQSPDISDKSNHSKESSSPQDTPDTQQERFQTWITSTDSSFIFISSLEICFIE